MSETIIMSLITLASGAIGAISGAYAVIKTAKITTEADMKKVSATMFHEDRLKAYIEFYVSYTNYVTSDIPNKKASLMTAINKALLVASEDTAELLAQLSIKVISDNMEGPFALDLRNRLSISMQNDLITAPKIKD